MVSEGKKGLSHSMGESLKVINTRNRYVLTEHKLRGDYMCVTEMNPQKKNRQMGCRVFTTFGKQVWVQSMDLYGYSAHCKLFHSHETPAQMYDLGIIPHPFMSDQLLFHTNYPLGNAVCKD
jgi:hypothetical protein